MFYEEFLRWCERKGVTGEQAAKDMGLGRRTPSGWKRGVPGIATCNKLQAYFGLTTQEILDAAGCDPYVKSRAAKRST